jgi:hypothetical protein
VVAQDPPLGRAEGRPEDHTEYDAEHELGQAIDDIPGHHTHRDERDQTGEETQEGCQSPHGQEAPGAERACGVPGVVLFVRRRLSVPICRQARHHALLHND